MSSWGNTPSPAPLPHSPARPANPLAAERRKNGIVGNFSRKLIEAIGQTDGPVLLIRGWEKPEPLQEEIVSLFPERDIRVSTLNALKREGAPDVALLAVLQADALVSRDDFRADERAAQLLGTLAQFAPRVVIQTAVPARFDGSRGPDELLEERRQFGFPPYTRLVEVRRQGSGEVLARHFLARDRELERQRLGRAAGLRGADERQRRDGVRAVGEAQSRQGGVRLAERDRQVAPEVADLAGRGA